MAPLVSKASGGLLALVFAIAVTGAAAFGLGQSCSTAYECSVINALCINNRCACNATSDVLVGNKCILSVGARCFTRPCEAENSFCSESKFCVCENGYQQTYNNSFCFKIPTTVNDYCEVDHDCAALKGEAICKAGNKCGCKDTSVFHENVCKLKVGTLGGSCIPQTQVCFLERNGNNQSVECVNNICKCKAGVEPSKDFMSCGADSLGAVALAVAFMVAAAQIFV